MKTIITTIFFTTISTFSYSQIEEYEITTKVDTLYLQEYQNKIILNDSLSETSGLQYIDNFIYTFNDSGGKAEIYKIEPKTGKINQTIILKNAKNKDWEAITYDGNYIYIGDFGNNKGNRTDLTLYKFNLEKINPDNAIEYITPSSSIFELEDQEDFSNEKNTTTDFDIESLFFDNKKLHLLTKEWTTKHTKHHTLETYYKFQFTKIIEELDTDALITDASLYKNRLLLVSYTQQGMVYLFTVTDFKDGKYFNGNIQKTFLGFSPSIGQIEGITQSDEGIYISGESINMMGFSHKQVLYFIPNK